MARAGAFSDTIKSQWANLAVASAAVITVIGAFVLPPPFVGAAVYVEYSKFLVAALVAIAIVFGIRYGKKRYLTAWICLTVAFLVLSAAAFALYQTQLEARTCAYATHQIVVGNAYTPDAKYEQQILASEGKEADCTALLLESGGRLDQIWSVADIEANRQVLSLIYVVTIAAFALTVLTISRLLAIVGS